MAEGGTVARVEHSGDPPSLLRQHPVSNRIDAFVQTMESSRAQSQLNCPPPYSKRFQLPPRHDPMLPLSKGRNSDIDATRSPWCTHKGHKGERVVDSPPGGGGNARI